MRISDSRRVLFVHVPKTGGATVERLLDRDIPDIRFSSRARHASLVQLLETEPALADYWIFGFVRNPWARMVSWWSMIDVAHRRALEGHAGNRRKFRTYPVWRAVEGWDFETFVTRGPDEVARLRMSQVSTLSAPARQADFIGRTETFAADVATVRRRLGLTSGELPHEHRGDYGSYRDYYTPVTRDRVAEVFKPDIEEFGYQF